MSGSSEANKRKRDADWQIDEDIRIKYARRFNALDTERRRTLCVDQAYYSFKEWRMSNECLSSIWKLADIDKNNMLVSQEFILAMQLCKQARKNNGYVPKELPYELVPPLFREGDTKDLLFRCEEQSTPDHVDAEYDHFVQSQPPDNLIKYTVCPICFTLHDRSNFNKHWTQICKQPKRPNLQYRPCPYCEPVIPEMLYRSDNLTRHLLKKHQIGKVANIKEQIVPTTINVLSLPQNFLNHSRKSKMTKNVLTNECEPTETQTTTEINDANEYPVATSVHIPPDYDNVVEIETLVEVNIDDHFGDDKQQLNNTINGKFESLQLEKKNIDDQILQLLAQKYRTDEINGLKVKIAKLEENEEKFRDQHMKSEETHRETIDNYVAQIEKLNQKRNEEAKADQDKLTALEIKIAMLESENERLKMSDTNLKRAEEKIVMIASHLEKEQRKNSELMQTVQKTRQNNVEMNELRNKINLLLTEAKEHQNATNHSKSKVEALQIEKDKLQNQLQISSKAAEQYKVSIEEKSEENAIHSDAKILTTVLFDTIAAANMTPQAISKLKEISNMKNILIEDEMKLRCLKTIGEFYANSTGDLIEKFRNLLTVLRSQRKNKFLLSKLKEIKTELMNDQSKRRIKFYCDLLGFDFTNPPKLFDEIEYAVEVVENDAILKKIFTAMEMNIISKTMKKLAPN